MIEVLRVQVPAALLRKMTSEERIFFLLMGQAENQISMLFKVVHFSSNFESENEVEQLVSSSQTQVILRLLIGIIYETWIKLINDRFLKRSNITVKLTEKGESSVAELRAHFSNSSLLGTIRNSFAFHYPNDQYVNQAFKVAAEDKEIENYWNWYLSEARTNTSYYVSEVIFLHGVMKAAGVPTLEQAQNKLMAEVLKVHGLLCDLFDDIGNRFMEKYFSNPINGLVVASISTSPSLNQFVLPFYANVET